MVGMCSGLRCPLAVRMHGRLEGPYLRVELDQRKLAAIDVLVERVWSCKHSGATQQPVGHGVWEQHATCNKMAPAKRFMIGLGICRDAIRANSCGEVRHVRTDRDTRGC